MSLDTVLQSIVTGLAAKLPELKTCSQVGGLITLEEMRTRAAQVPAGFVACLSTTDGKILGNKLKTKAKFILVLAVDSRPGGQVLPQDKMNIINRLVSKALFKVAAAKNWGDDEIESSPQKVESRNPYTTASNLHAIALWSIMWEQDLALGDPGEAVLDDFLIASTDYQVVETGPPIDAHDDIQPEQ